MIRRKTPAQSITPSMGERDRWANSLERLVGEVDRETRRHSLIRRDVGRACADSLLVIACVLREESFDVTRRMLKRLEAFITDGATSSLYGANPTVAGQDAGGIRSAFLLTGAHTAGSDRPRRRRHRSRVPAHRRARRAALRGLGEPRPGRIRFRLPARRGARR
jgi:hypothetical protein